MELFFKRSWPFLLLAVLSFFIHFAFLSYPSQVVFDEVHFGKFVAAYSTGQYYFDIHPPLGKLLIAGFVKLTGANPVFDFGQIGESLPPAALFALRFLPAFFGAIFTLLFSWLAYLLSRDKATALIAGFLVLLDNAFLVQSKFILVDIFMLFFEALALSFFLLSQRQKSFSAKWLGYLTLTAIFFGLTISVKWTGLATIGIIGTILLAKIFSKKLAEYLNSRVIASPAAAGRSNPADGDDNSGLLRPPQMRGPRNDKIKELFIGVATILVIGFLIYLLTFYLHFKLLTNSGPGDAFMSRAWQQELKYGQENVYQPLSFWQKFTELNKTMYTASAGLTAEHAFGSKWYSWPLNNKPAYYWNQDNFPGLPGWQARIYLSGNPTLWWLAGLSVIFTLLAIFFKKVRRGLPPSFYILTLAYLANLLPFIFISRVSFLYHYLAAALYAVLLLSLWLASWRKELKTLFWTALILVIIGFAVTAPLSYGWPLPNSLSENFTRLINLL